MSSLISRIKRDPVGFSVTPTGRLLTTLFRSVPSAYDTDLYKLILKNKPIKIVFSGMGDSKLVSYAKDRFTLAYVGLPVYVFGHGQLQLALDFANKIPRDQPVLVFGYSWGSPTAMKFIDRYNGTINKAHYIDPMRHAVVDDIVISNRKNIPTTYMTAGKYGGIRKLHDTLLAALRMKPALSMVLLPQVKNHMALLLALKYIKLYLESAGSTVANFLVPGVGVYNGWKSVGTLGSDLYDKALDTLYKKGKQQKKASLHSYADIYKEGE